MLKKVNWEVVLLVVTLTLGAMSYALDIKWSHGLYGAVLVIDLYALTRRIQNVLENQATHEYLPTGAGIWDRAIEIVNEAKLNYSLIGTTSSLNDLKFEEIILKRMSSVNFTYKRVMCYHLPDVEEQGYNLPAIDDIQGKTKEERLDKYLEWYAKFYKEVADGDIPMPVAMNTWYKAIKRIQDKSNFEIEYHKESLPTDFLILKSEDGHYQAAILAFPRRKGESMGSGFRTKNPRLAYDFSLNLDRLTSSDKQRSGKG